MHFRRLAGRKRSTTRPAGIVCAWHARVPSKTQNSGGSSGESSRATKGDELCCGDGGFCVSKPPLQTPKHDARGPRYTRRCVMWSETSTSQQRRQRHPPVPEEGGCGIAAHIWCRTSPRCCSAPGDADENTQTVERRDCVRKGRRSGLALCLHQVSRTKGL